MKNRNWICYALDIFGLTALGSAGLALISALWFAGTTGEPALMMAFRTGLMLAVAALIAARSYEIFNILMAAPVAKAGADMATSGDNVEILSEHGRLSRAA